jgi:D-alanine-D-alanine ligase-like ATP-grasp enzyme
VNPMPETYFPSPGQGAGHGEAAPPPPAHAPRGERPTVQLGKNPTATTRFIAEHVEPQYAQLRRWNSTLSHEELLQRAARRKRMTIKKITESNQLFFLSGVLVGGMDGVITSLVSHQARRVSRSKAMTKRYLSFAEVPTPKGKAINPTEFARAVKYMKALGKRVAVKPSAGRAARGISVNVTKESELRTAWQAAMAARSATSESRYLIVIEEYTPGLDVRCYVVGGQVVGAVARLPLYVVGDGVSTVGKLADEEIARRRPNEYLKSRQPDVSDSFLAAVGVRRESVLPEGKLQYLTPIADTGRGGGIAVDVLELLSVELKELAVDGLWAITGLGAAAVDLLVPDLGTAEGAVVLEVNPYANIMQFHYPSYGEPRKINDAVLEEILERASR